MCVCVHFLYDCDSAKYFHESLRAKTILQLISKVPEKVWHIMAGDVYLFEVWQFLKMMSLMTPHQGYFIFLLRGLYILVSLFCKSFFFVYIQLEIL